MRTEVRRQKSEVRSQKHVPECIYRGTEISMQYAVCSMQLLRTPYSLLLTVFYCCILLTILSGCIAITAEEDPIKKDMNSLRQDAAVQQQKLGSLEETIKKGVELQTKRLEAINESLQKDRANLNASIDRVRENIAFLNGKFGEVEAAIKNARDDAAALQEKVIDKKELDNKFGSIQNLLVALEKRLLLLEEKLTTLEQAQKASVSDEAQKEAQKEELLPKADELYNEALRLTKDKDYSNAIEKFAKFISLFPEHDLAQNAYYWLGEIYYAQKDYEKAVLEFNEVVKKYPNGKKVPASLLKQGMAFNELGNKKEARLLLERVRDKYPKTEEADKAKKMLRELK
ncbi:MAG: tol-pal system protein YbgF [Deltaproteobacteria bacterium GWC2_42_51]|nr:MAG: tol-pal system protein YbgF [Deltaproteobacteria bacterium GWA2_42_85]OGP36551.1 MAG: tol-pal system protein YbgF [Deltaproteobacteria bacterium GWC2_42_51]OGP41904.1 MAG: tol-pal system protein YbgF [Deltaproteobacteria bacterium GWD2_42_10]OGP45713.1 MAG: tol-pal system protein YbgF [Deltaproteobacteria bacterium GWF2_42_12]OGQ24690.1 MAG: tol-pal system protein YbgF [Deltaproteobacteria bacterium RIFCSPHIGHO2_02_FULL_42_44]OGQ38013.1 MAG: tol-pal system protein YbgF [Deltaproteobact